MLLILKKNFFYRSFWRINKMRHLTSLDLKYLDLDAVDTKTYHQWLKGRPQKGTNPCPFFSFDVSYWNTYTAVIPDDNLIYMLLGGCTYLHPYGLINFRTDNMYNSDFDLMIKCLKSEKTNDNWKTSQLTLIEPSNPHWNLYRNYIKYYTEFSLESA
jgi:hypothetical protein